MKKFIFALLFFVLSACHPVVDETNKPIEQVGEVPTPVEVPKPKEQSKKNACETIEFSVDLVGPGKKWKKTVKMPASGKFVGECHYITKADVQILDVPKTDFDRIQPHLDRECLILKAFDSNADCSKLHSNKWQKCWTPSEGGNIAAGSIGLDWQRKSLSVQDEMFGMNMMWGSGQKPKPGTKFLLSKGGKFVVAYAGHETGPGSKEWLGGVSPVIQYFLSAGNESEIKIEYLKDQSIESGPIDCEVK